jgi:flagellar biosynthesis/type III secretory pathway chaperone
MAEKARALNQTNGKLIATRLASNQQALATLMAAANQAALYGPDGQARPLGGGRSLGSV